MSNAEDEKKRHRVQSIKDLRDMTHGGPVHIIAGPRRGQTEPATYFEGIPRRLKDFGRMEREKKLAEDYLERTFL